jgi:hypothetical protein
VYQIPGWRAPGSHLPSPAGSPSGGA